MCASASSTALISRLRSISNCRVAESNTSSDSFTAAALRRHSCRQPGSMADRDTQIDTSARARPSRSDHSSSTDSSSSRIIGERLGLRIGILAHAMERHLRHGKRRCIPPVHVFHKSIRIEEIIALPLRGQGGQFRSRRTPRQSLLRCQKSTKRSSIPFTNGVTSP